MDVDQVVAHWEADEKRVRARWSATNAEPEAQVFGLSGMQMFEAIFSGELPPPPMGDTLGFVPIHMEPGTEWPPR